VVATVRPSFALYDTHEDIEAPLAAVRRIAAPAQGGSRGGPASERSQRRRAEIDPAVFVY
jgi:hypothetical protein